METSPAYPHRCSAERIYTAAASCYKSRHFSPADRRRRPSERRPEKDPESLFSLARRSGEYSGLARMDPVWDTWLTYISSSLANFMFLFTC
ncbi:hypothetical protein Q7C36_017935 [Tachysurus vachellii]|uniref:Uncharacterized protein n=1 Tax=Tachysurus vachellii TaxID=175792 RepID=A0AA88SC72_TACVA|nr:hypothetical protein Q7C36_017935 [Tachysurus vachellii]